MDNNGNPIKALKYKYPPYLTPGLGRFLGGAAAYYGKKFFGGNSGNAKHGSGIYRKYKKYKNKYKRYRKVHPKVEVKTYYYKYNINAVAPFAIINTNTAASSIGFFGNQLHYIFTPANGIKNYHAIGNKVVVKSIEWKLQFMLGSVTDPTSAPQKLPVNIRFMILRVLDNVGTNHFDIGSIISCNNSLTMNFGTQGKTVQTFLDGSSVGNTVSKWKILHNELIEMDDGYVTESSEGKVKCGFTTRFFEGATDTGDYSTTAKNLIVALLLTDQNYGDLGDKYPYARCHFKTKYYDA